MLERVKNKIAAAQKKYDNFQAERRNMTPQEYKAHQEDLKRARKEKQKRFELYKVQKDYEYKRKSYQPKKHSSPIGRAGSSAFNAFTTLGTNVNRNIQRSSQTSSSGSNLFLGGGGRGGDNLGGLRQMNQALSGNYASNRQRQHRKRRKKGR